MKKCRSCRKKTYGYSDGVHHVWVCWSCGQFEGSGSDPFFPQVVMANPQVVWAMIGEKMLKPIESGE
jgi:ribosomal protein L37AE/L43A